jgi:hypothetical protein
MEDLSCVEPESFDCSSAFRDVDCAMMERVGDDGKEFGR